MKKAIRVIAACAAASSIAVLASSVWAGEDCNRWSPTPAMTASISYSPSPACVDSPVSVSVVASDLDTCYGKQTGKPYLHVDPQVHYQWTVLPAGCQNPNDQEFVAWTPSASGDYTFTCRVYNTPDPPYQHDADVTRSITVHVGCTWSASGDNAALEGDITSPQTGAQFDLMRYANGTITSELVCVAEGSDFDVKNCGESTLVADSVTFTWTASGGSFPNGNVGQAVVWKPDKVGLFAIHVQIDDANTPLPQGDCGSRDDAAITKTVYVMYCAHPVLFEHTGHVILSNGWLYSNYTWQSSSNWLPDLANVVVGEYIAWPPDNNVWISDPPPSPPGEYYQASPPFAYWLSLQPTMSFVPGNDGEFDDVFSWPVGMESPFLTPYSPACFSGTQIYRYEDNLCSSGWQTLRGPLDVRRCLEYDGTQWIYACYHDGDTATYVIETDP